MATLRELALKLRPLIEKAAASLEDNEALDAPQLFPQWNGAAAYLVGDRVQYNNILYKCLQAHSAQENWDPETAVSLWAKVLVQTDEEGNQTSIAEWEQPDSTNAYMIGDKVSFEGNIYESTINNNVWSPSVYPGGWKLVEG